MTDLNLKDGARVETPCGHFGTARRVSRFGYAYEVDFDPDSPEWVSCGNCFHEDGTQFYPGEGKAARIDPVTASIPVGTEMQIDGSTSYRGFVIACALDGALLVETRSAGICKLDPVTHEDRDGDQWSVVKPVGETVRFWNVYADGSIGSGAHATFEAAYSHSKYRKVRVGILRQTKRGGAIVDAAMIPTVPTLRTRFNPSGSNPFA